MKPLIFVFILLSFVTVAQDKAIKGSLRDNLNDGVPFFQIALFKSDSSLLRTVLTDTLGKYRFNKLLPGKYIIGSNIGSKKFFFPFDLTAEDSLKLLDAYTMDKKQIELSEIKIFGKKNFIERDFDKLTVNIENMVFTKGNNVLDILPQLPGIKIDVFGDFSLNGKGAANILIDGKSIGVNGKQAKSVLNTMSAENLEKIEIISNPSSKYDSQGSGGLINVVTKKNKASSELRSGVGTLFFPTNNKAYSGIPYNSENIGITLNYLLKKVKTFYSLDISKRKEYQEAESIRIINSDQEITKNKVMKSIGKSYNYRVGGAYDISKNSSFDISITGSGSIPYKLIELENNDLKYLNNLRTDSLLNYENNEKTNFSFNTLSWGFQKNFIDKKSKNISIGFDVSSFKTHETSFFEVFNGTKYNTYTLEEIEKKRNISIFSQSVKLDYSMNVSKVALDFGVKFTFNDDNDVFKLNRNLKNEKKTINVDNTFLYKENINAAYINAKKNFKTSKIQIGLRNENTYTRAQSDNNSSIKRNFLNLFPNISYQYTITKEKQLQMSYSRRIRRPTFEEYNSFLYFKNPLVSTQGNPYLNLQFTNVSELTYNTGNKSFLLSYSITQNVRDIIISNTDITLVNQVINLKKVDNLFLLFTSPISYTKKWSSNNSIDIYYQKSTLLNNNYKGTVGFDFSTNHNIKLKNSRIETRFSYASPYQYGYNYAKGITSWYVAWNKDLFKNTNINVSFSDILGTARLNMVNNYGNQIIYSNAINNSRSIRFSIRYKFKSGNSFGIKNRPNVQNNEVRIR